MRIYVAGASKQLARCKRWIGKCREAGYIITHDWTGAVEKYGSGGNELTFEERLACARSDLIGVYESDVFWLLAPPAKNASTGSWIELGYALRLVEGSTRLIYVSPAISERVIFALMPRVCEFDSDEDAFRALALHEKHRSRFAGHYFDPLSSGENFARERVRPDGETADKERLAEQADD